MCTSCEQFSQFYNDSWSPEETRVFKKIQKNEVTLFVIPLIIRLGNAGALKEHL